MRRHTTIAIAVTCLLVTSGCTQRGTHVQSGSPPPPVSSPAASGSTPTPAATIDPQAAPAVTAYQNFQGAAHQAQRHPVKPGSKWPSGADFTQYSFDPIRTAYVAYIASLNAQQVQYRGTPDVSHVTVTSVDLHAKPWPTVILTDCQIGHHWAEYVIATGRRVPLAGNGDIPPPYLITAKMIFYQGHWGLMSNTADKSRTCTAA